MSSTSRTTGTIRCDKRPIGIYYRYPLYLYSIGLLLDSLQEAENQRRTANGAHVEIIDRSLEIHETRLTEADTLFYGNMKTALADKTFQFENINYYRNKKETALRKINLFLNHRGENATNVARSTAISKIYYLLTFSMLAESYIILTRLSLS